MNRFENWLCLHHPIIYSKWQDFRTWFYVYRWRRYLRRNRDCCEYHTMKHCAEKLAVNPKKATCYAYVPEHCPDCGRKIPKRIIHRWMDISLFIEHYEDAKLEFAKELKRREQESKRRKKCQ